MYTRSYRENDTDSISLPAGYDGTAFSDVITPKEPDPPPEVHEDNHAEPVGAFGDIPILSRLFGGDIFRSFKFPSIGTEEILLIAAAAFLFFSKDGDKECAIMLILLVIFS